MRIIKHNNKIRNFWTELPRPFFALAPMANVTDSVFRKMLAKYGKPDVTWTEFVSADGLVSVGKKRLLVDLKYSSKERPIVAQLFSSNPVNMKKASQMLRKLKFDGLDLNMGCPDKAVEKQGSGASLMKNPKLALELLQSAREGFTGSNDVDFSQVPVSVKTRVGYNKVDLDWVRLLLEQKLPALTVHLRTRKEMSDVPAQWHLMSDIVKLRNEISPKTLIIGNGDVVSVEQGLELVKKYGCDGVMIGRGIFGKPWMFENIDNYRAGIGSGEADTKTVKQRLSIMVEHAKLYEKTFKDIKSFDVMKKHFKAYVNGWDGAKELRIKLMNTKDAKEVKKVVVDNQGCKE